MDHSSLIVCIGSPLLDIIVKTDCSFLTTHKLEPNFATVVTDKEFFKKISEINNRQIIIGGSVTNTVRVLQAILRENNAVTYLGSVGNDANGKLVEERLKKEGVHVIFNKYENINTGMCAVLICGANRSLCTDLGASSMYSIQCLNHCVVKQKLEHAKCIYFSGFFLGVSFDCVKHLIKLQNKTIAFNIGARFLCKKYPEEMVEILKYIDIVFGNDHEAQGIAEILNINEKDIKTICSKIKAFQKYNEKSERIVVITRGADSLFVAAEKGVEEYEVKNVKSEEIEDTNGAGDAFVGGFLAKFLQGRSIVEAVNCGIVSAQEIIKNVGCCFDTEKMYRLCE